MRNYAVLFLFLILLGCVQSNLRKADELRAAGAFVEARGLYAKIIGKEPENAHAHFGLGMSLSAEAMHKTELGLAEPKDWYDAIYHMTTAFKLSDNPEASRTLAVLYFNLGTCFKRNGHTEEAIARLEKSVEYDSTLIKPLNLLGAMYHKRGNLTRAQRCYRRVVTIDPNYALGHFNLGALAWARGDFDDAARSFEAATKIQPGNQYFHTWTEKARARIE